MNLPRYVVARKQAAGLAYYWQVPKRNRVRLKDGAWFPTTLPRLSDDPHERAAQAKALNAELDSHRATMAGSSESLPVLIEAYEASHYFRQLKDRTKDNYRQLARRVIQWSALKGHPNIQTITTPIVLNFLSRFEATASLRDHIANYLAVIFEFARRTGKIDNNPARKLGLKRAKRLKPIRVVDIDQMLNIVNKAREMGMPHVAMGTLLHFDLGQRQGDVLRLQKPRDYRNGVFHFVQAKTDQVVTLKPFLQETRDALAALPATQLMLVADKNGSAVEAPAYSRDFRIVARAAGFPDLWEMELRHSCVIYMERAGLTPAEIATRTGHGLASVIMILENYRYRDSVVAEQGAVKLEAYRNRLALVS